MCGFHVAFITVTCPSYIADLGLSASLGALAIGLVGLFNIVGSYGAGVLGARHSPRLLLSGIYTLRAVAITLFLLAPVERGDRAASSPSAMGVLWLSTVPLTSAWSRCSSASATWARCSASSSSRTRSARSWASGWAA